MGGEMFSYRIDKSGVVRIFWEGRCVTTGGVRATQLATELENADAQRTTPTRNWQFQARE